MLEVHRVDVLILKALSSLRHGGTIDEITEQTTLAGNDPVSEHAIKRHIPGLLQMELVRRIPAERDGRPVFVYEKNPCKNGERAVSAEGAPGRS